MKPISYVLAASLLATCALGLTAPAARAFNSVTAQATGDTSEELEYKAYAAQLVAQKGRQTADSARARSNAIVAIRTTTKLQRTQADLDALRAENYAAWAEASYDQAEVNAATTSEQNAEAAELRARRSANALTATTAQAHTAALGARAAATALEVTAPNQPATRQALGKAFELEEAAYRLQLNQDIATRYEALTQENFTKAKARVIAGRAITAHRGIKGHLSLPLHMPLSKPMLVGPGEVGPRIVGTPTPDAP